MDFVARRASLQPGSSMGMLSRPICGTQARTVDAALCEMHGTATTDAPCDAAVDTLLKRVAISPTSDS
eukprot:2222788-Pleurochrysis_carterae.AAC.1